MEDRILLYATVGGAWQLPIRITYSFVPDGTNVGGTPSSLFQTFNAATSTANWEQAIAKAAAIWEEFAKINLVQVPDSGDPIGAAGLQQGDSRFGDIRLGAIPEPSQYLAFTYAPPPILGGTLAGDIFFNSTQRWMFNNDYDIETVAIHELGHALGMAHSTIAQAVMYAYYQGVEQSLNPDDVAGIQSLYGAPTDPGANHTLGTALDLTPYLNGNQVADTFVSMTGVTDAQYYKITVPSTSTGTMTVTMQATNLSSLSPNLTLYNPSQQAVVQSSAPNVLGATVTGTIAGVQPGQVYWIRAMPANAGPGSAGAYALQVNFGSTPMAPVPPLITQVASQPDQGGFYQSELTSDLPGGAASGGLPDHQWYFFGPDTSSSTTPSTDTYFPQNPTAGVGANDDFTLVQVGDLIAPGDALRISPRLLRRVHHSGRTGRQDGRVHHQHGKPVKPGQQDQSRSARIAATNAAIHST